MFEYDTRIHSKNNSARPASQTLPTGQTARLHRTGETHYPRPNAWSFSISADHPWQQGRENSSHRRINYLFLPHSGWTTLVSGTSYRGREEQSGSSLSQHQKTLFTPIGMGISILWQKRQWSRGVDECGPISLPTMGSWIATNDILINNVILSKNNKLSMEVIQEAENRLNTQSTLYCLIWAQLNGDVAWWWRLATATFIWRLAATSFIGKWCERFEETRYDW